MFPRSAASSKPPSAMEPPATASSPPRPREEEAELGFDDYEEEEDPEMLEPWFTSSSDAGRWPGASVFRLVVPAHKVRSVIGPHGETVKRLSDETRARVRALDAPLGAAYRIVLVSAKEEIEAQVSPAMNAAIKIFKHINKIEEINSDGTLSASAPEICSARLLVPFAQAAHLLAGQGFMIKAIQENTGTTIRIIDEDELLSHGIVDERIVEICGASLKVLNALKSVLQLLRKFLVDHNVLHLFERKRSCGNLKGSRFLYPPRLAPLVQATSIPLEPPSLAPAPAAPAPAPAPATAMTPAAKATPGSFSSYPTWLSMPPALVSNYSAPMVQNLQRSASSCSMQEESDMVSYPPGGFRNFMTGSFVNTSSHAQYAPFEAQQPQMANAKSSHSLPEQNTPHSTLGFQSASIVDIDKIDGNEGSPSTFTKKDARGSRPAKRMIWTPLETMRLVSAWLKNSNDLVKGNWKRNDQYWGSVTTMFNSTTPGDRTREIKQLKEQWHHVNKSVYAFQGCWIKAERIRDSGESDEQVMDHAKAFYEEESDEGEFKLEACWKVLQDQPKWHAYIAIISSTSKV